MIPPPFEAVFSIAITAMAAPGKRFPGAALYTGQGEEREVEKVYN